MRLRLGLIVVGVALLIGIVPASAAQSTPAATTCDVAPRALDELAVLAALPVPSATPGISLTIGEPLTVDQLTSIETTVRRFIDCSNAGEPLRVYALYSDRYLQQMLSLERPTIDQARYDALATPMAAQPGDVATLIDIEAGRRLADGRLGAEVTITYPSVPTPKTFFFTFVATDRGLLIDDILGELTFALP
jgi:hypothetical protein